MRGLLCLFQSRSSRKQNRIHRYRHTTGAKPSPSSSQLSDNNQSLGLSFNAGAITILRSSCGSCEVVLVMEKDVSVDPEEVDALLAKELYSMSLEEREKLYEEIHGVHDDVDETPDFLRTKLTALEMEIQLLIVQRKAEFYQIAFRLSETSMTDRNFRLMFLRAEYYNPQNAARRIMQFLERKKKYFGEETLGRPLLLTDMNEDDMECLRSGILQLLPTRDSVGRAVIADMNMDGNYQVKNIDSVIKSFIYILSAAAEDEETQRRGIVSIYYFSMARNIAQGILRRDPNLAEGLPVKMMGLHICTKPHDPLMKIVKALIMLAIGKSNRLKVRVHEGSATEVQYGLLSFGLPTKSLPVTYEGELKVSSHLKWIQRRHFRDKAYYEACRLGQEFSFNGVDLPWPRDVLLGRGKTVQEHFGNAYLRSIAVAPLIEKYKNAVKSDKNSVGMEVVKSTKDEGGRFLKRYNDGGGEHNGWWREVDDSEALDKVCKTFRAVIVAIGKAQEKDAREPPSSRGARLPEDLRKRSRTTTEQSCCSSGGGGSSRTPQEEDDDDEEQDDGGWSLTDA